MADNRIVEAIDILAREHVFGGYRPPGIGLQHRFLLARNRRIDDIKRTSRPTENEYQAALDYLQNAPEEQD